MYRLDDLEFKTLVYTNSLNIRDDEISAKRDNEFRILCLGDSYTFGLGVDIDDAFVTLTEELLNEHNGVRLRFSLINAGGPTSACKNRDFLIQKGIGLEPDAIIVQTFIGNDFYDALAYTDPGFRGQLPGIDTVKQSLSKKIYFLDFIWNRLIQIDYIDDLLFRCNIRYSNKAIYLKALPELERSAVASQLNCLESLLTICKENNIKMLLINIPDKPQVFKRELFDKRKYYYRNPNQIIKDFCRDNNIPYLDFLDHYEKLNQEEVMGFYYLKDIHWTKEGHSHAAGILADFIKEALE
ncbi:SGNH/GDSL hydrolase family protein [Candidatus Omnitrophota bacterium]